MKLTEIITQIDLNQRQIDAHGKLNDAVLKTINYKFRLDWNYYSNHMEGGTLTRDETRSVMVGNIEVHGKPLKDVMEMNGHDRTVLDILKMGKGEQRISEKRIKAIHKAIMHEDDPEQSRLIGDWKDKPNEIINYKGEKIDFAPPSEVKERVHTLLDRLNAELDKLYAGKPNFHPLITAAQFHIDFVTIHPFYDGNGRATRILTNLLLVSFGYPPIIVKEQHKQVYYQLLADIQVYGGQPDLFYVFVGERLLESQELVLKALNGEDIEEEEDLEKEIDIWIKQQEPEKADVTKRNVKLICEVYQHSLKPLFELVIQKHQRFDELFTDKKVSAHLDRYDRGANDLSFLDQWTEYELERIRISSNQEYETEASRIAALTALDHNTKHMGFTTMGTPNQMGVNIYYSGYKKNGLNVFDESTGVVAHFDQYHYRVVDRNDLNKEYFKKFYSEKLNESEINQFVHDRLKETFERIKNTKEEINNRGKI